jgi:hypothetical protein
MSFALTTEQVENKTKTVTRRNCWNMLKVGDKIQPVVKCMGLKKGEKQQKIGGPIEVVSIRKEPLNAITQQDVIMEGFPGKTPEWFIEMYCKANRCAPDRLINRIEYRFL